MSCHFLKDAFLLIILTACPAKAFICTAIGTDGPSVHWNERTVHYVLDSRGTKDIDGDSELDTLRQSFEVWNNVGCSDLTFVEDKKGYDGRIGFDYLNPASNQNSVTFYEKDWPYSSLAIALTTLTVNNCTGQILDADMELNSANFQFTNSDTNIKTDLQNTAVHEIGHMLGLDHTFQRNNVMYPYANTGETRCRQLFDDDINAICFKYPKDESIGYCYNNDNCKDNCRRPGKCDFDITAVVDDVGGCQDKSGSNIFTALVLAILIALKRSYCSLFRRHHQDQE